MGDMLGWNIDKGYIDLAFSSQLDANGTPCLVIDYQVAPVYDYPVSYRAKFTTYLMEEHSTISHI